MSLTEKKNPMQETEPLTIFWFRRDLRLNDNRGLYFALQSPYPVQPLFIFDQNILSNLSDPADKRVNFIYEYLQKLKQDLNKIGSDIWIEYGKPNDVWKKLVNLYNIREVHANTDYEPYASERDQMVSEILGSKGISFHLWKDQVIFEKEEILGRNGKPYTIYTPYSRAWMEKFKEVNFQPLQVEKFLHRLRKTSPKPMPELEHFGFKKINFEFPPPAVADEVIINYGRTRDFPFLQGTTRLGIHLRFGTISIRELVRKAKELSEVFLKELIWREFFMQILWHFPYVANRSFKTKFDKLNWLNNEEHFKRWCNGETGYPIVDAGMRQLNQTGYMHNRVRMITASFLTKHLLIDWRWGEAYFAEKLLDYELASNNGNWQWAAGTGCDAAPYFRIFNPIEQQKKFDPNCEYIRQWVKKFGSPKYPEPIVEHKFARQRALEFFRQVGNANYI